MSNAMSYLLELAVSLVSFFFIARFLFQACRVDFYNPISQGIVQLTDPVLKPLRYVIPGFRNLDFAAIVVVWVANLVYFLLKGYADGMTIMIVGALLKTILFIASFLWWAIIIMIVLSFVAPGNPHPAVMLLHQITDPIMAPARRLIPPLGGLDFSPILVLAALHVITLLLEDAFGRFARALI